MAKKKGENYDSDGGDDQDYDEEPNFDDPEGFVDDVTDEGRVLSHTSVFLFLLAACQAAASFK